MSSNVQRLFVLGTGRSGTRSSAALLSRIEGVHVVHQLDPPLLAEVNDHLAGQAARADLVNLLRRTRGGAPDAGIRVAGESNQRLSFILDPLHEAFPRAKYLWVIRDGRDAVASMHHRLWYQPDEARRRPRDLGPWAANRITGDLVGDMSAEAWRSLTPFAKCAWYWAYSNRLIPRQAAALGLDLMAVRLADLARRLPDVLAFIGVPGASITGIVHSAAAPQHWWRRPVRWRHWTAARHVEFEEQAGAVMDDHFSGWRDDAPAHPSRSLVVRGSRSACCAMADLTRPLRPRRGRAA
jgi:hypothetical protein